MDSNATTTDANHSNKHGTGIHVTRKLTRDNLVNSHQTCHSQNRSKSLRMKTDHNKQ